MDGDRVVQFRFSKSDQIALEQVIRGQLAGLELTAGEIDEVAGKIWLAWVKLGDRAGLLPVEIELPKWVTEPQRVELLMLWKTTTQRALEAYRAVVLHERIEREVELVKNRR